MFSPLLAKTMEDPRFEEPMKKLRRQAGREQPADDRYSAGPPQARRGLKSTPCYRYTVSRHPTKAAPEVFKVLFENERVRVVELNVKKGTRLGMHKHPAYFAYAVTPFDYKSTSEGGKTERRKVKKSGVDWSEGESHSVEFMAPARALVVELK